MVTKKQWFSLYTGPKEDSPRPGDFEYHFMEAFFPIIDEWSIDDFGAFILVLKDSVELTKKQIIDLFTLFMQHDITSFQTDSNARVKLTLT